MSGITISFPAGCAQRPTGQTAPPDEPASATVGTTTTAHLLALAHLVERQVEAGEIRDYREAARRLGISRAHIANISNLLSLAPAIQERILMSETGLTEGRLRHISRVPVWSHQVTILRGQANTH